MTGLADVEAAPMLGPDGKPITTRGWFDSESIALDGEFVYIGLEASTRYCGSISARVLPTPAPKKCRCRRRRSKLPYNKGLEALVMVPKGHAAGGNADRDLRARA